MQIMLLLQRQTILRLTTVLLLTVGTLLQSSEARTVDVSPEKSETITFIHDDDKIDIYRSHDNDDAGKGLETDEDNEVISVRLLNSFQLMKPYAGLQKEEEEEELEEGQNVSYENILESEDGPVELTSRNDTAVMSLLETSTVSTSTSSSSTTSSRSTTSSSSTTGLSSSTSSSSSTSRSTTVEVPTEQATTSTIEPMTRPSSTTTSTTLRPTTSTSTVNPVVVTPQPIVFGNRKRTARNHADYYQYPSIDLDQLDFDDLEYSDVDGMRLKELLATRFIPKSSEQHHRDQPTNKDCPCATEQPQSAPVDAEDYDYYQDLPTPQPHPPMMPHHANARFARRKRLQRQQPEQASEEYLAPTMPMDGATSMERAERMHGALERIMGIVTIMSHVDNFIQKKTKQSIRRLARLYESSEK
ncbi:uncharacterized protein LOC120414801 [Culex pipiens pallens]|uniref:uncharacterized protein LOC120414801 n=1 Tax=Culex pipiens pallens TaxID=42434 RepID=UPI0022AB067F|nr:uncharacterized protein LOC120414801 [Culex pipiens pallens]